MKRFLILSSSSSEQSEVSGSSEKKEDGKRKTKYRKYDDRYLDYGFTCVQVNNEESPQRLICLKVLALESMLPCKLKRHLESLHPNVVEKSREFFQRKLTEAKLQKTTFSKQVKVNSNTLLSSSKVSFRVAQCKKPHTMAEELILPAAVDMVIIMLVEDAGKQLLKVPLSNTISRRINDMADDINDQLICNLKGKDFALQLDEATYNQKDTHLICYVRFVNKNKIVEDLLFCKEMKGGTTGQDLFVVVGDFMVQNQIDWERCVGVCTDGGRSMAGCYQGLQACIRSKALNAVRTHCIIHREALAAAGNLSEELHNILKLVNKVIHFIKTRPMKARFFAKLCEGMGAEHSCLFFYSSSRWPSLGNSRLTVYELRNEIHSYLHDDEHCFADKFIDADFLIQMAFLSDLFEKLNALNKSLQVEGFLLLAGGDAPSP
ncbi:zinc finger BED domain-containing protein 5-like [Pleurodeles waltl]|uniref:zinc finger BED domain-containing protein 5-like n=1 Tax=Pleurodeles waltl TaxID=8319 RepID=UPI00370972FB